MEFTLQQFNKYVEAGSEKFYHQFYKETVKKYKAIKLHADGEEPGALITKRRPSESKKIQDYRKEIFVPITKSTFNKVVNSLMKIRKSQDWSIKFYQEKVSAKIRTGETLQDYMTFNYPKYTSITNWYFQVGLRNQLVDTNAKVFVMPLSFDVPDNEYLKPYPFIYNSPNVIDYKNNEYFVLKSEEQITFVEQQQTYNGDRYYVVTDTNIQIFDQYSNDKKYRLAFNYAHNLEHIPVYDFKGSVCKELIKQTLYDSRIIGMIPFLDEAIREYSDMQAEVVQHMHSTMWVYGLHDCKKCKGTGVLIKKENNVKIESQCDVCGGKGIYPFNPYENFILGKAPVGENTMPTPPADFITKPIDMAKLQYERIENHIFKALAALGFEYLAAVPLATSGVSKQMDREEGNNTAHGITEDGVELLDNIAYCTNEYRNKKVVPEINKRLEQLPVINVPEKYDLINDTYLLDGLTAMRNAKVDVSIVSAAEIEFAAKRFNTDPSIRDKVALKLSLDPFPGLTVDEVNSNMTFDLINKEDAVIHANISLFIEKAIEENKGFAQLPKSKQMELLRGYAQEFMKEQSAENVEIDPTTGQPIEQGGGNER